MALYKVEVKPISTFKSNLTSITVSGAIFNTIAQCYGVEELERIYTGAEVMVVSNMFNDKSGEFKSSFGTVDITRKTYTGKFNTFLNYSTRNMYFLVEASYDKDKLKRILEITLKSGIGAIKSVGNGIFDIVDISEYSFDIADVNGYMVLSDYIPDKNDSTIGKFKARVYRSCDGDGNKKAPVFVINAGSKFKGVLKELHVGRILKDANTGTYISGQSIVMPIKV